MSGLCIRLSSSKRAFNTCFAFSLLLGAVPSPSVRTVLAACTHCIPGLSENRQSVGKHYLSKRHRSCILQPTSLIPQRHPFCTTECPQLNVSDESSRPYQNTNQASLFHSKSAISTRETTTYHILFHIQNIDIAAPTNFCISSGPRFPPPPISFIAVVAAVCIASDLPAESPDPPLPPFFLSNNFPA